MHRKDDKHKDVKKEKNEHKPEKHVHVSVPLPQKSPRLFQEPVDDHVMQEVSINITVNEPQEDTVKTCFAGFAKCFGK